MSEHEAHPYRTAWRTRDLDAWGRALAADVVLHSPQLAAKRGRLRGPLTRLLNAPLRSLFTLIDTTASRLTQRR